MQVESEKLLRVHEEAGNWRLTIGLNGGWGLLKVGNRRGLRLGTRGLRLEKKAVRKNLASLGDLPGLTLRFI